MTTYHFDITSEFQDTMQFNQVHLKPRKNENTHFNGNNLMTCASMLKVVHRIPGESIFTCQV